MSGIFPGRFCFHFGHIVASIAPLLSFAGGCTAFGVELGVRLGVLVVLGLLGLLLSRLWGRVSLFYCWHFAMQVSSRPHALTCL